MFPRNTHPVIAGLALLKVRAPPRRSAVSGANLAAPFAIVTPSTTLVESTPDPATTWYALSNPYW